MIIAIVLYLAVVVLMIASQWKVFVKAGQPGWACLVPIYNIYIMTLIAKKPTWWIAVILLVPLVNFVFLIMLINGISKAFGKTEGFTAGLIFLGVVFWPILAFGDAQYQGEKQESTDLIDG
jgi:hypothetical protein